jgi:isopenicillin-N N-acyltransferase-like protein
MIELLDVSGRRGREAGLAHGEHWRAGIGELFAIRWELLQQRSPIKDRLALLSIAHAHLPVLRVFDGALADELDGIAEGAGLEPWQLVVVNHYTDFRDIPAEDGGCSVVHVPLPTGRVVAQTWDMHGTAEPYVALLRVGGPGEPVAVLFTIAGCLGMAGMNEHGVSVCINNMTPDDARVGVLWPALVRRMLRERTAGDAYAVLQGARLSSGHNYLVADESALFNVETTARVQRLTHTDGARIYWHTNHYTHPDLVPHELPLHTASTSRVRDELLRGLLAEAPSSIESILAVLGSHEGAPGSICAHLPGDEPSAAKTCGAVVCDIVGRRLLAARGCAHGAPFLAVEVRA